MSDEERAEPAPDIEPDAAPDAGGPIDGAGLVNLSFLGTGVLVVATGIGVVDPDAVGVVTAVVSCVLFAIGVVAFLWGYATGVVRSRDEAIDLGGLFFLAGSAPRVVAFRMRIALLAQVLVAVVAASVRPYTAVAFAVLAPMLGLGLMSMWGARHGRFSAKAPR